MNAEVKKIKIYIVAVVCLMPAFLIGVYYFTWWASWDFAADFVQAESCLDGGGVWEHEIDRCWYAGVCEDEGGYWYPAESRCVFE